MKAIGIITIEEGLVLNNPTMILGDETAYSDRRDTVRIECIFNEENSVFKHSRMFYFDTGGLQITKPDIWKMISEHPILKDFV